MIKTTYDCSTGKSVQDNMTAEEIAEWELVGNTPSTPTHEDLLMLALSDAQLKLQDQQNMIDQLALVISEMQIGGKEA